METWSRDFWSGRQAGKQSKKKYEMNQDGADQSKREAKAEEDAFMKGTHRPLRLLFNTIPELKDKFGPLPMRWEDLRNWDQFMYVCLIQVSNNSYF
jgi:hypothetical protein